MIDTIAIIVPYPDFKILDYDMFEPSAKNFFKPPYYRMGKKTAFIKCIQNPSKKEMREGNYKPRLTLTKRLMRQGFSIALKIEFSAPKLIFGNNFDECIQADFELVLRTLHEKLIQMKVLIELKVLRYAEIVNIHYGKNIELEKGLTSSLIIKKLAKLDISKRLDIGNTDFRNNGQAIRYHANSYELTFYDKMKDLQQSKISEKRGLEKDYGVQRDMFQELKEKDKPEILRMELRLNGKRKLKEVMRKVGINDKATQFYTLFNSELAKRSLLYFWKNSISPSLSIIILAENDLDVIYTKLRVAGLKETVALQVVGCLNLIKDNGIRGLKQLLNKRGNTYRRTKKAIKELDLEPSFLYNQFKYIERCISSMKPLKLSNYKERL